MRPCPAPKRAYIYPTWKDISMVRLKNAHNRIKLRSLHANKNGVLKNIFCITLLGNFQGLDA